MATKNVELLSTDGVDVLHPITNSDLVNVQNTNQNLTAKLSAIDVATTNAQNTANSVQTEVTNARGSSSTLKARIDSIDTKFSSYLPLAGGTLTGNLTAPTFVGALNGNSSSATKLATARTLTIGNTARDFDGTSSLTWTLANIGALPLTGGTLTGNLTMGANIVPNTNNSRQLGSSTNRFGHGYINELHSTGITCDTGDLWITSRSGEANHYIRMQGSVIPNVTSSRYLGVANNRWHSVWAANGTIQTSDERYKGDIQDIDDEQFFEMVKGTSVNTYVMLDERKDKMTKSSLDQPENKQSTANSERVQVGIIAQDMAQFDCAKYILVHDEETDIYSVNNYNFTSAVMGALKVEIQKREELEDLVLELKKEVDTLKAKVA